VCPTAASPAESAAPPSGEGPRPARSRSAGGSLGLVCIAASLAFFSCRKSASPPAPLALRLGDIELSTGDGDTKIDATELARRLRGLVEGSGLVATAPSGAGDSAPIVRMTGRVGTEVVEAGHKGLCRASVSLIISTRPSDAPGALRDELSATGEERFDIVPGVDRAGIAARVATRTATDLLNAFLQRERLRIASPAEIHAVLMGDGGVALREAAIRQVAARRLAAEAPAMLALLDDSDEATRDAALGALIALHDRRAVAKLTRDRSLEDKHEMMKTLDAIALIGGTEAAEYLSFVADSHDDPDIRQAAKEARERLARRTPDASAP
jgi:hypothetical protein